jgi:uncharacterized protein YfdQ (DUF2303 family)
MAENTETQSRQNESLAGQILHTVGAPHVIVPEGYSLHDLEKTQPAPRRSTGTVVLKDVASFVLFFNEQKGNFTPRIYGSVNPPKFTAVFNDDASHAAGWGDYKAQYSCPYSIEWQTWQSKNKQPMNQADFAQFIEDNLPDILDGATLLEVSRSLEAKKKVNFASAIRLSDGQNQFTYEEQVEGTANKGQLKIPETFDLGIPVFEGGPLYKVSARLRYRITEGKLGLWYDLERPHKILEDAVKQVWADISTGTTVTIFNGAPAA